MADNQADFEAFNTPLIKYLNNTTARLPFQDGYDTNKLNGDLFHCRPVIGGVFIRMLTDKAMWKKWASMDKATTGNYAPLPVPPLITEVVPTSRKAPVIWSMTTDRRNCGPRVMVRAAGGSTLCRFAGCALAGLCC